MSAHYFEESLQSVDLNQRIIAKLEHMKNSPVITMHDSFLGDEGCRLVVDFLNAHDSGHVSKLDLKGNNIGERGTLILAQYFQGNDHLKKVSLEWNNIGLSDGAVSTLASALMNNVAI